MSKILAIVIVAAAFCAQAAATQKTKSTHQAAPCDGDFELTLTVEAVDPAPALGAKSDTKIGLHLVVDKRDATRSIASRDNYDKGLFDHATCERWQKNYWNLLSRLFVENARPERKQVVCHNVGVVDYRLGKHRQHARFCLTATDNDDLTVAFREFYEGTDLVVAR